MRVVLALLAVLGLSVGQAQGVLARMHEAAGDELVILAEAKNSFRVPFIEVDREVPNIESVMRLGILEEETNRYVVITPEEVHVVEQTGDDVAYWTPDWDDSMFTRASSRFNRSALDGEGQGARLDPNPPPRPRTSRSGSSYAPRSSYPYSSSGTSCTSSTSSYGSSMTCRSGGRITYTINCTVNPVTFVTRCDSRSY